jgi:hypothetical protein
MLLFSEHNKRAFAMNFFFFRDCSNFFFFFFFNFLGVKHLSVQMSRKTCIPAKLFQTSGFTSPTMTEVMQANRELNPHYEYVFFDDQKAANFLQAHFPENVYHAFDFVKAGAFKADLLRLAILWMEGGVYIDCKQQWLVPFDDVFNKQPDCGFFSAIERRFVAGFHNAFLAATPRHPFVKRALDQVVNNILGRFYGKDCLSVSGPTMFGALFNQLRKCEDHTYIAPGKYCLHIDGENCLFAFPLQFDDVYWDENRQLIALTSYIGYAKERRQSGTKYWKLWRKKKLYDEAEESNNPHIATIWGIPDPAMKSTTPTTFT